MSSIRFGLLFLGIIIVTPATAQQHVLGLQLDNLIGGNISPYYERSAGDFLAVRLTLGVTPSREVPGSQILRSLFLESPESSNFGNNGQYQKWVFTPEVRAYFLQDRAPGGPYGSLFLRCSNHRLTVPYSIPFDGETIDTESGLRLLIFGGGLGIGWQLLFAGDRLALDIYVGGGVAYAPVRLSIIDEALTDAGYEAIYEALDEDLSVNLLPEELPNFLTNNGLTVRYPLVLPILKSHIGLGFVLGTD